MITKTEKHTNITKEILLKELIKKNNLEENLLDYIDYDNLDTTTTTFTFPTLTEKDKLLDDDKMLDIYYTFFAYFLKYQYKLTIKYLEPDYNNCSYISQKSLSPTDNVNDAYITIEPLHQNIFKQISYTPINQIYTLGTIVTLHEKINYTDKDLTTPSRKILTSSSLKVNKITDKDIKYKDLCNKCIPYSTIDVGSEIIGKFTVKNNTIRESMSLYQFRRPDDNILEIITPDYLNVNCNYILTLTKECFIKDNVDSKLIEIIDKMLTL